MKPNIVITAGDPLGIGPEITVKALRAGGILGVVDPVVVGEKSSLIKAGWTDKLGRLIPLDDPLFRLKKPGPDRAAGLISYLALRLGLAVLRDRSIPALVTAPISKEAWVLAGVRHTGHTEVLRVFDGAEPLMAFTDGRVNAALVTEHLPVAGLSAAITAPLIEAKARLFAGALRLLGSGPRPSISLCALNPHAGDGGKLGGDELRTFAPAVKRLRAAGLRVSAPLPSDVAWKTHLSGASDGVLCAYHDQALTPLKLLGDPKKTVHWTHGLSFIRSSPAHGTAFDIAGRGRADASGMIAAIRFAAGLAGRKS